MSRVKNEPCFFNVKITKKGSGTDPKSPILLIREKKTNGEGSPT